MLPVYAAAGAAGRETHLHVTINTLTADARTGQAVMDAVRQHEQSTGRKLLIG